MSETNQFIEAYDQIFNGKSDDEIIEIAAKALRQTLQEPIDYGFDAISHEYFLSARTYNKSIYIHRKYIQQKRWGVIVRGAELLERAVNEEKEKVNVE